MNIPQVLMNDISMSTSMNSAQRLRADCFVPSRRFELNRETVSFKQPSGRFYSERSFGACDCSISSGGVAAPQAGQA